MMSFVPPDPNAFLIYAMIVTKRNHIHQKPIAEVHSDIGIFLASFNQAGSVIPHKLATLRYRRCAFEENWLRH